MEDLEDAPTKYRALPPGLPENLSGIVLPLAEWILVKRGGTFEIAAQQLTARATSA
jgi:hypothetical protein